MGLRVCAFIGLAAVLLGCSGDDGDNSLELRPPQVSGLDSRPDNASCLAPERAAVATGIEAVRAFPNLSFASPVAMVRAPNDLSRWFVVEERGRIRVFDTGESAAVAPDFVDLRARIGSRSDAGLLGLAFHPDFATNGLAYVHYLTPTGESLHSVIAEYSSPDGGLTLDPGSERILLSVATRAPAAGSGGLEFGPDRHLYAGQAGWILRMEVDVRAGSVPQVIATDPRGWSFDRRTGQLWPGDSSRSLPAQVIAGHVYRGRQSPALAGRYLFVDADGRVAALRADGRDGYTTVPVVSPGAQDAMSISAFAEGEDGELYALDKNLGQVRRLVFTDDHDGDNVPHALSETGCVNMSAPGAPPMLSLIPFKPNAVLWSDGATKDRWIGLPNGLDIAVQPDGDWDLPNGTVLVKHFRLGNRLVETRLFMRHPDGGWAGYTYQWNESETEATRVSDGLTVTVGSQEYTFPSEADCMWCHNGAAGFTLGPETGQLNGKLRYPQTGRNANQLTTLNAIHALAPPVTADSPAYADHADANQSLDARARAYLHINCSICHRPGGPTPAAMDLRHDTPLPETGACGVRPSLGDLGIANARIIAPGDRARSELLSRMSRRDAFQMPPLASHLPDGDGVALVGAWIDSLTAASCR